MGKQVDMHKPKQTKATKKDFKSQVKGTDKFMEAIKNHLKEYVKKDPLFKEKLFNKKKNFKDCITFIFNQVQKMGKIGYEDEEIFQLARHYYDEDTIEVGKPITQGEVIVNQHYMPSEEEIEKKKKEALDSVFEEERKRLREKKTPSSSKPKEEKKKDSQEPSTLF